MLQNFRTYQKAKDLYLSCQDLKLKNPIKDQFNRALLSRVLNLAEGSGKPQQNLYKRADEVGAMTYRLMQSTC